MVQTVIFGGTAEGREIASCMQSEGADVLVSVTSEYARSLLPDGMPCHVGALNREDMLTFLRTQAPQRVIDATHPFARLATQNIRACCSALGIPCERIERPQMEGNWRKYVEAVPDTQAAVKELKHTGGSILLTTGSNTVGEYAAVLDRNRLWVRVLPKV